ncbi:hypothetical protein [Aurantibacter sp.]|uniref:hypothetical protein n=1 Tax=Aurantibacter sp. TaxID=2807103 RepID=UPI003267A97C
MNMKVFSRFLLLFLWLFAITAPSIITLLDTDNPIIITNLNEEEQQEVIKKSSLEEKMLNDGYFNFSLITLSDQSDKTDYYTLRFVDFTLEILLPPPEHIS